MEVDIESVDTGKGRGVENVLADSKTKDRQPTMSWKVFCSIGWRE